MLGTEVGVRMSRRVAELWEQGPEGVSVRVTLSMACSGALRPPEGTSTPQSLLLAFLYTLASVPTQLTLGGLQTSKEANQLSPRQSEPKGIARVKQPFSAFSLCLTKGGVGRSNGHSSDARVKLSGIE